MRPVNSLSTLTLFQPTPSCTSRYVLVPDRPYSRRLSPCFQLTRVFPITHSLVLSRLFFSPHSTTPGTILIAIRVTNPDEFERCTAVYRNKAWPGASLRFVVLEDNIRTPTLGYCFAAKRKSDNDETGEEPSQKRQSSSFSPMYPFYLPTPPPHPISTPHRTPVPSPWATLSQRSLPTPPQFSIPIPPPPIIFPQVPMDVDPNQSAQATQRPPSTHCCDVAKAKADIQRAAVGFMNNFEESMVKAFGPGYKQQGTTSTSSGPPTPRVVIDHEMDSAGPVELPVHTGVVCDVCESTIRGIRHKCLDCPGTKHLDALNSQLLTYTQTTTCALLALPTGEVATPPPMNFSKSRSPVASSFTPFLLVKARGRRINPPLLDPQFQNPNRSPSCTTPFVICATPRFMEIDTYVEPPTHRPVIKFVLEMPGLPRLRYMQAVLCVSSRLSVPLMILTCVKESPLSSIRTTLSRSSTLRLLSSRNAALSTTLLVVTVARRR